MDYYTRIKDETLPNKIKMIAAAKGQHIYEAIEDAFKQYIKSNRKFLKKALDE